MPATADVPRLWLHSAVRDHFLALPGVPWEVGGWLLGYWTGDGAHLFVTHATPPGPRGTPFGVHISGTGHGPRFEEAWVASGGHVTFVGDWHTHPGGDADPSTRDREALQQLASKDQYRTPEPLIAIVETPRWPWRKTGHDLRFFLRCRNAIVVPLEHTVVHELPPAAAAVPTWSWSRRSSRPRQSLYSLMQRSGG